ncbi:MAG: short-chain dehydrogenase, partial [Flavobacteriaceae bacterium]
EDWYEKLPKIFAPAKRIFLPEEIAEGALYLLSDACGPVSGQVLELEQFPMIGRNPPKEWEGSHL